MPARGVWHDVRRVPTTGLMPPMRALFRGASSRLAAWRPHAFPVAIPPRPAAAGLPRSFVLNGVRQSAHVQAVHSHGMQVQAPRCRAVAACMVSARAASRMYSPAHAPAHAHVVRARQELCASSTAVPPSVPSPSPRPVRHRRAYTSGASSSGGAGGRRQRTGGGGSYQQRGSAFSFSGAHVACYGAMLVVTLPALGKTFVVLCDGKTVAPPASRMVTAKPPRDEEGAPATLVDLFSILDGEWAWLGLAIAVTLLWAWFMNSMPVVWAALTAAVQKKEPMDTPIFNFVKLQVTVMVLDSVKHFVMSTLGERVRQRLRVRLYGAMLQQEIGFFDANSKGQLMSMMGEDVSRMQQAVTDNMTGTIVQLTTICQCAKKVLEISPYATLLVIGAVKR
jgi:hypothetical protein